MTAILFHGWPYVLSMLVLAAVVLILGLLQA